MDEIPCRTTEVLFKRLKEEIIRLKDEGSVLMRFNELRDALQLRLSGEFKRFADEELRAVLTLLAGPGVVWELTFGSWVPPQPVPSLRPPRPPVKSPGHFLQGAGWMLVAALCSIRTRRMKACRMCRSG